MAVFPSLYRARAVQVTGSSIVVFVPQVFGETAITIDTFFGAAPEAPSMGWVMFQAGNPEFPVWSSGLGGGGGEGANEVWIGPELPSDATGLELWYDEDATASGGGGVGTGAYTHIQSTPASIWTIDHNLGFNPGVTVVDSANSVVEGQIDYLTVNTVRLTFTAAFSGKAYLS